MKYILMADDMTCVEDLTTCCSDYGIAYYLFLIKRVLELIHIVVPIILILMATIDFVKMVANPDDPQKKKTKSLYNKFFAAILVFLIPFIVNVLFNLIEGFNLQISGCWKASEEIVNKMESTKEYDAELNGNNAYSDVDNKSNKSPNNSNHSSGSSSSKGNSKKGEDIANYAKEFVGNQYVWGGVWNGEKPYTGTDCSGFVQGVYKHFGINLARTCTPQSKQGVLVASINDAKPGDLFFYGSGGSTNPNGDMEHVSMYIGNNQVVHASGRKTGIKISAANYRTPATIRRYVN